MRKGLFYICLLLVGVGLFAGCKSKKAVVASFSDLDGEWGVVYGVGAWHKGDIQGKPAMKQAYEMGRNI